MSKRQELIVEMFNNIAPTYDVANRILSAGIDKSWRKKAVKKSFEILQKKEVELVCDVACGTGDMILFWQEGAREEGVEIKKVVGIDPSVKMLEVAKEKIRDVDFIEGYANRLELDDGSCDILSIVYGLRNVIERKEALKEFARVLRSGGLLVVLEFTNEQNETLLQKLAGFYKKKVLPLIGGVISGNYQAYKYLPDSIEGFLSASMLEEEMREIGFTPTFIKGYSANISTTFIAKKI